MAKVDTQQPHTSVADTESPSADKDALVTRLDELLEKYLHTLDQYQKTREQLSRQLSSGYMSLAQANFQNRSATHYGQDSYDERMQAARKVVIEADASATAKDGISFSVTCEKELAASNQDSTSNDDSNDESKKPSKSPGESKKTAKTGDAIRWFGILVPPALRSAQSSFVSAVEGSVPQLATITKDLRIQEIEIGRVRKQIKKL
ncbi:hypothetical protein BDU57DRAFT_540941 [Ampelomyces quisqualis]|uniref:Vacuolar ATPase assembly protein VMA22 n=1 Tax=Ampelomyces quisqualis TaxID=50730 RepID=A0A6A5QD40_AMPQU|nr:hypothetical protein BDU57DRAFT_540941 [Ampelomyces quisqualis]